jgi:hypothetical protein
MKLSGQVIIADAATYSFRDEPTVVFLYNPFGKTVLRRVVEQMSKVRAPLYVVYVNALHAELLEGFEVLLNGAGVMVLRRDGSR